MLTEGDRTALAPHLAKLHAARAALAQARQTAAEAERHVTAFRRGTTMWDRWFNRDGPTGLAYREARTVRRDTTAAVAQRLEEIKALEARLDRQIGPMMPRLDPDYEAMALVIEQCGFALAEIRAQRDPIHNLVETVREATKAERDENARKDAVGARLRYPNHLAQARRASGRVKRAVDPVRSAVAVARVPSASLVWNDSALARLPRTAEGLGALGSLARDLPKLRQLPQRLDRIRADLTALQKQMKLARQAARIRARDKLIEGWGPDA
jgi:hypothetical protein